MNFLFDKLSEDMIVKIMFQDDFFIRSDTLQIIADCLGEREWLALGCTHFEEDGFFLMKSAIQNSVTFYPDFMPRYDDKMPRTC